MKSNKSGLMVLAAIAAIIGVSANLISASVLFNDIVEFFAYIFPPRCGSIVIGSFCHTFRVTEKVTSAFQAQRQGISELRLRR